MPHPGSCDNGLIQNNGAALADSAQRQLGLPRHADLAHDQHIQLSAKGLRYHCCDWDPTAWEAQNQCTGGRARARGIPKPCGDQLGQEARGIGTVPEHPSSLRPRAPLYAVTRPFLCATAKIRRKAKIVPNDWRG